MTPQQQNIPKIGSPVPVENSGSVGNTTNMTPIIPTSQPAYEQKQPMQQPYQQIQQVQQMQPVQPVQQSFHHQQQPQQVVRPPAVQKNYQAMSNPAMNMPPKTATEFEPSIFLIKNLNPYQNRQVF